MPIKKEIPPGYQLVVRSWENDGDHYKTQTISGLTHEQVKFYLYVGSFFRRAHTRNNEFNLTGNDSNETSDIFALFKHAIELFPEAAASLGMPDKSFPTDEEIEVIGELHEEPYNSPGYKRINWDDAYHHWLDYIREFIEEMTGPISEEMYASEYENFVRVYEVFYIHAPPTNVTHEFPLP